MKKSPLRSLRLLALFLATVPVSLIGSGTRTGFKDAFATARGNAFAATADSAAAIYYNPAGLTQLDGQSFSATFYNVQLASDYTSSLGTTTQKKRPIHVLPQFYYAWTPRAASWAFGLGAYVPFGLSTEWSPASGFATLATKAKETDYAVAAMAAWQVTPELSIGGGPVFHKISATLSRDILPVPGTNFTFDGSSEAVSFNAGIRWQPNAQHAFGLSYQGNYSTDLNGTASYTPAPPFPGSVPASANFAFPEVIIAGYSYRPSADWNFEFNAEWMNWERVNTILIQNAPLPNLPLILNWRSSFFYDFGVTRVLASGLKVSAGYTYAENSTPNATYTPAVPDANRHLFGFGVAGQIGKYDVQVTLQYGFAETRTVSGSPVSPALQTADGIYRSQTYALAFSLSRHF
jgi:long-chain fatty acid transport protein